MVPPRVDTYEAALQMHEAHRKENIDEKHLSERVVAMVHESQQPISGRKANRKYIVKYLLKYTYRYSCLRLQ